MVHDLFFGIPTYYYTYSFLAFMNQFFVSTGDEMPSMGAVHSFLDIMGLLNGLLLSSSFTLVMTVNYDSLIAADERFTESSSNSGYVNFWNTNFDYPPSTVLYTSSQAQVACVFSGIIIVVYMYSDLVTKVRTEDTENEIMRKINEHYFSLWWQFTRFAGCLLLVTTTAACVFSLTSLNIYFHILYPDYYIEEHGIADSMESPTYIMYLTNFVVYIIVGFSVVIATGLGSARVHLEEYRMHAAYMDRLVKCHSELLDKPPDSKNIEEIRELIARLHNIDKDDFDENWHEFSKKIKSY